MRTASEQYETSDLAQGQIAESRANLQSSESVTSGERFLAGFQERAANQVAITQKSQPLADQFKFTFWARFRNESHNVQTLTQNSYEAAIASDLLDKEMFEWFNALPDEDKAWVKQSGQYQWMLDTEAFFTSSVIQYRLPSAYKLTVDKAAIAFGNLKRQVTARGVGRMTTRAATAPQRGGSGSAPPPGVAAPQTGGAAGGGAPAAGARASIDSGGGEMVTGQVAETVASMIQGGAGETVRTPGTEPAAVASAAPVYNISVGTVVSGGADSFDLPGRDLG
jgi:hypothetical protein